MKTIWLCKTLLFLFLFLGSVRIFAQDQTIKFSKTQLTISEAFDELEQQTDFTFAYTDAVVDVSKPIQLSHNSYANLTDALNEVLKGTGAGFKMRDKQLLIVASKPLSQNKVVTGRITDAKGLTLPAVSVMIKGTNIGVFADLEGNYNITIPAEIRNPSLRYVFMGYQEIEQIIGNKDVMNVSMIEDISKLDEVIVVGYGTQKKGELTSSISNVKSESFVKGAVQDAAQLLKGKVAGMGIAVTSGDPTATSQISLRGIGTLKSGTTPLVIIDGVPGDLNTVAPEDIESIDVVKDGSAAAIYGTRGNNGVIFITTKKVHGVTPMSIEVHGYATAQQIVKRLEMMSAAQYRELVSQNKPGAVDYGYETNWLDEILQTPLSYVTNASFRGGNATSNYIANVNYNANEGIIKRSDNNVFTTRLEINHNMWDNLLKFNFNLMGREQSYQALADGNSFRGDIYRQALINIPTERPKDDFGNWTEHTAMNEYFNPVSALNESDGLNKSTQLKTFGSVTLTPIKSVFIKALLSRSSYNQTRGYSETQKNISAVKFNRNGFASRGATSTLEQLMELTSQYREQFNKHGVTALLGYSYQDNVYENYWMQNWDFPSDQFSYNNMGAGAASKRGEAPSFSTKNSSKLIGFFGRFNYNYDDRYLASVSLRREGSSKFGANHKWGSFPAASLGWNISNEAFMENLTVINVLKLRAGFGITGTTPNDSYMSLSQLTTGANFYQDGKWIPTLKPSSNPNPDLKWETKEEWNIGLDYEILKRRIFGSIDIYRRKTKDMLWDYQVAMPPYLYPTIIANAGSMENKGIEVSLSVIPISTKDIQWTSNINYSTNSNKLLSLSNDKFQLKSGFIDAGWTDEPIQQNTHRIFEGGAIGNFWGFKSIDIDDNGRWIIEDKEGKPKPIAQQQPDDKKVIGNGLPKHLLSWNNTVFYKNFDLTVTMRGAFDYQILNFARMWFENPVSLTRGNLLATAYQPKYGKKVLSDQQDLQYISYYVENGSFWKIDNITLGYNLNLKNKYLKKIRLYVSGSNLLTFTAYTGLDPEVNMSGLDPGIDKHDRYPTTRSFTLGAMFTL